MKRNLLLLAVMLLVAFGFSSYAAAQCPNPADPGECDTLYVEPWPADTCQSGGGPYFVRIPIYVTHDLPNPSQDSISGFCIPLCYTHSNVTKYCSTSAFYNALDVYPDILFAPTMSIFRHFIEDGDTLIHNWMLYLSQKDYPYGLPGGWNNRILDLGDQVSHFWLMLSASGSDDRGFEDGSRVLLATVTFKLEDSAMICVDTCFWPPSGNLAFAPSIGPTYIPQIWDDYLGQEEYCFTARVAPNTPPNVTCPGHQTHNMNGSYIASQVVANDPCGFIAAATVSFTGTGVANVALVNKSGIGTPNFTADVSYDVVDHCQSGGVITVTVIDDMVATGQCTFDINLTNPPPVCTCPDDMTGPYGQTMVSTNFSCTHPAGPVTVTIGSVTPTPANMPMIVGSHVEWDPECSDINITYTVELVCTDMCGVQSLCSFTMLATNDPPVCTCPDDMIGPYGQTMVSTNFSCIHPGPVNVAIWGVSPTPANMPVIVGNHVEWAPEFSDVCITYTVELVATDMCGSQSLCSFTMLAYAWSDATSGPLGNTGDGVGVAWGGYDSDGDLDLYLSNWWAPNKLFRNDGVAGFADDTYPPLDDPGQSYGVAWGDLDNDGDIDLYLSNEASPNRLFRNDISTGGYFTDIASQVGVDDIGNGRGVALGDYDLDGDLDIYLANSGGENKLFENDLANTGVFNDVTAWPVNYMGGTGMAAGDYDNDGDLDIYLSCSGVNKLFENLGNMVFDDATTPPLDDAGNGQGVACADYDNDGDLDIYLVNSGGENKLFENVGGLAFVDATQPPLDDDGFGRGCVFFDYDNDSWQDIYLANNSGPNKLFRNELASGGFFADVTCGLLLGDVGNGNGVAYADYDNDGDLDLYLANADGANKLFRNELPSPNWLQVNLVGVISNISGIGARVRVVSGGISQIREISGGSGFCSQNSSIAAFGLGYDVAVVETLQINWPSAGIVQTFTDVPVNGLLEVHETEGIAIVKIPNKVYERFGFGHWDYFCWQEDIACDNYIIPDDACPPYWGINPGDFFEIPILLDGFAPNPVGGFELEVEFDYIDLTFYGAMRGGLLERRVTDEDVFWSWEYFTYRVLPCNIPACHKYKILLFGQSEMPDGSLRRGYCLTSNHDPGDPTTWWYVDSTEAGEEIGATLAWLKFQVANNELLRDLKLPIFFEWEHKLSADTNEFGQYYIIQDWDCAENTMSSCDGNVLYVSNDPLQYNPDICSDTSQYPPLTILEFVDGGVHICSPCTAFKCVRGDINLDHIPNSTADAVLFARYFVEGIHVFVLDRDEQVCATDVNADGRTLMLSDLVYLIRVILQDAAAIPKLAPSSEVAQVMVSGNTITTECASPIGAILFEFDGSVDPTLLADNMEMVNKNNKVLVWSTTGNTITTAEVLSFTGDAELVSVTAVDYDTRELQTSIIAKVAPTAFALNPAYPNPFNPFTNLSFTLPEAMNYSLKIYNVAGQLVRNYEGMGSVGLNLISWDGKDNAGDEIASGVYFYRLTAGSFSATRKMVVVK